MSKKLSNEERERLQKLNDTFLYEVGYQHVNNICEETDRLLEEYKDLEVPDSLSPTSGTSYACIEDYDMGTVELAVLGACNTASGLNNITKDIANNGAGAAVGWSAKVSASSHSYWLERFVDELAAGSTVTQAKQYANSFTYNDSDVKKAEIEGDEYLTLSNAVAKSLRNNQNLEVIDSNKLTNEEKASRKINIEKEWTINYNVKEKNEDLISILCKEDSTFNLEEYKVVVSETKKEKIIDYIKLINGVESNAGFTIFVKDEIVTDIYKNNIEKCDKKLINSVPKVNEKELLKKVLDNLSTEYKVIEQSGKLVYDVNTGKYNYIVLTDYIVNEDESLGRGEYSIEIN